MIAHNAPPNTLLHVYYDKSGRQRAVSSATTTSLLYLTDLTIPGHASVYPQNIAACSLRSSDAMALLLGSIELDKIIIVGRW